MPPDPQPSLSEAEREVLKVLWDNGPLGVRQVVAILVEQGQQWTRSTIVTLLHRLEAKGYIDCDKSSYAFVYRPAVSREDVMHARIHELAADLSDGKPVPLMLAFAERHKFTAAEFAPRLERMIDDLKRQSGGK